MFSETEIKELESLARSMDGMGSMDKHRSLLERVTAYLRRTGLPDEDEPVFLVRGTDPHIQGTIMFWITRSRKSGVSEEKLASAHQRYRETIEFQSDHPDRVKVPD